MTDAVTPGGMPVRTRPTAYTVACLPELEDGDETYMWSVTVEYRGRDLWAVTNRGIYTLNDTGKWDLDPDCRNREDDWLATHRFTLSKALNLAQDAAPEVIVNGMTPADFLAWHTAGRPVPNPRPHSRAATKQGGKFDARGEALQWRDSSTLDEIDKHGGEQ